MTTGSSTEEESVGRRVALRHLLAREQLAPALGYVEQLVHKEDWREAKDALFAFGKALGVFFSGADSVRISTEWFGALDNDDKSRFLDFLQPLRNMWEVVAPRARDDASARPFEWITLEAQFKRLREDLPWVQDMMRDDSDAHRHGPFLVIPTKGVHDTTAAEEALDAAAKHIQGHFPQVLYGKVYVRADLRPKGTFDARPGSGGVIAGAYQGVTDTITVSMYATPERNSVMTLVHEFGHRYQRKFLKDKTGEFIRLSTVGDVQESFFSLAQREKFADEWIERKYKFRDADVRGPLHLSEHAESYFASYPRDEFKANVPSLSRRFDEGDDSVIPQLKKALARGEFGGNLRVVKDEDKLHPLYASEYGREAGWQENFAECFLHYCTGKSLPDPLQRFMVSLR